MKRVKIKKGDIFSIEVEDGKFCYGQVIIPETEGLYVFFDVISENELEADEILSNGILFKGFAVNAFFKMGLWKIIGHSDRVTEVHIPEYKVSTYAKGKFETKVTNYKHEILRTATDEEEKHLDNFTSYTPNMFGKALRAHFGLDDWKESYNELKSL